MLPTKPSKSRQVVDVHELTIFLFWIAFVGIGAYNYYSDVTDPSSTIIVKLFHIQLPMISMTMDAMLLFYFGMNAWMRSGFMTTEDDLMSRIHDRIWS